MSVLAGVCEDLSACSRARRPLECDILARGCLRDGHSCRSVPLRSLAGIDCGDLLPSIVCLLYLSGFGLVNMSLVCDSCSTSVFYASYIA